MTLFVAFLLWFGSVPDDARSLMNSVVTAEAQNLRRQVNYLYMERQSRRSYDRARRLVETRSSASEVIYIEGRPAFRLVEINNRPLTADEQRSEAGRLRQLAEDRRNNPHVPSPAEKRRRAHPLSLLLRFHDFAFAGEDTLNGRECIIVESRPRHERHNSDNIDEERVAGATARYWIDKQTHHRVRMEVTALKPSGPAKVQEKTSYEWAPQEGDVWLITAIRVTLPLPSGPVAYYEAEQTYSNYRRFTTESNVVAVDELPPDVQ